MRRTIRIVMLLAVLAGCAVSWIPPLRAGHLIGQSVWACAYYQQKRERGKDHHAAVRALAFKWIRIVFRCWKDRVAYDENKYLAALARRGSPLNSVVLAATATRV